MAEGLEERTMTYHYQIGKCLINSPFCCRKFTLKDIADYLDELAENDASFCQQIDGIYIEPPNEDGELTGEDDANEDEGGIIDNVCRNQLNEGCEIVLKNGEHVDSASMVNSCDVEGNIEAALADLLGDESHSVEQQLYEYVKSICPQTVSAKTTKESTQGNKQESSDENIPNTSVSSRLRRVEGIPSKEPLPLANKNTVFNWSKECRSDPMPLFPEANYNDCRGLQPHELFEFFLMMLY
ncbi:uncharacterized protein LOC118736415 [Rhagoletis pomonella]|uniref:uncharacterized protein LOC118736415 n=1 Tax=Rhagoletis pomonella TaxID=28610 RepID=UPI00177A7C5B|nr:uncharacterized protein LOC118736415 [Rhagoletis pomonella]